MAERENTTFEFSIMRKRRRNGGIIRIKIINTKIIKIITCEVSGK